jgi:hypothetical protein
LCVDCDYSTHEHFFTDHIRIPVGKKWWRTFNQDGHIRNFLCDEELTNVFGSASVIQRAIMESNIICTTSPFQSPQFEGVHEGPCSFTESKQTYLSSINQPEESSAPDPSCCVAILVCIKDFMDDIRSTRRRIPNEILPPLLEGLRIMLSPIQDDLKEDLKHDILRYAADSCTGSIFDALLVKASHTQFVKQDPPEMGSFKAIRIIRSLTVQCIARMLVKHASYNAVHDFGFESLHVNFKPKQKDEGCDGSFDDVGLRLKMLLEIDGPALLAAIITSNEQNCVTLADRQFACWMLREFLISAVEISVGEFAGPLMEWYVWLLRCSSSSMPMPKSAIYSREIPFEKNSSHSLMSPPAHGKIILPAVRNIIIQEIRVLLTGYLESPIENENAIDCNYATVMMWSLTNNIDHSDLYPSSKCSTYSGN